MCKHIILVSIDFKSIVSWILYAVIQFSPSNSKLDAVVFLESEIVINRVLKQPRCTKIRQCTNVDEFNRHITKNRCETRKLEPAQSTLAKLVKALFEMERIFQEKDGKGKTPLFVSRGRGRGGGAGGCAAPSGRVFAPFWSEHGYTLCPFGLDSGMVFERTTECMNVLIVSKQFQTSKKEREIC